MTPTPQAQTVLTPPVLRYAAFTRDPSAGNPAGVVFDAGPTGLTDEVMLAVAADVGYSETAFLRELPASDGEAAGGTGYAVRYFSPQTEVPFCGHATVASAVAVAERSGLGTIRFETRAGTVIVETGRDQDGQYIATLTSVPASVAEVSDADVAEALAALGWDPEDLDPALPPMVAYAGAHHLVLAAATRARLAALAYDVDRLRVLMLARDWTTAQLVWRESATRFHCRNPFPVGGVVEDPATGAAAAAFGGYLRALHLVDPPTRLVLRQGEDLGRPGLLVVDVPADEPGIRVTGNAVRIPAPF